MILWDHDGFSFPLNDEAQFIESKNGMKLYLLVAHKKSSFDELPTSNSVSGTKIFYYFRIFLVITEKLMNPILILA